MPATVLDSLPVAVVLVADGRIAAWNEGAEMLYGHQAARVLGAELANVLFDADDVPAARAILAAAAAGQRWEGDFRVSRHDGVLLVSAFRAVPLGDAGPGPGGSPVAWVALDRIDHGLAEAERAVLLSAEHAARATAEEALGLVEAIVSSAPVGIAVFDLDLRYVRVNKAFAQLSGLSEADHIGGYIGEVVPLPPEVGADLRRVVTTGRHILDRALRLELRPGEERFFRVDYYPVCTSGGQLVGAGATVVEVTEARRAERERLELLARAEAAQRRLAVLANASAALSTTMDLDALLGRLVRALAPGSAELCIIALLDANGAMEHVAVSHRDRARAEALRAKLEGSDIGSLGPGNIARLLRTAKAGFFPLSDIDGLMGTGDDGTGPASGGARSSGVVVPVRNASSLLGALILFSAGPVPSDDDVDLAVEVAHRAALAVTNARAFQREHQVAEDLQRGLLPASVPAVPGLALAVRYLAATEDVSVGGDWYDVIASDQGTAMLVVGDVVGHNIEAASAMGQLRTALRVYAYDEPTQPAIVLARLDRLVDQLDLSGATCLLAVVDAGAMTLTWATAGHPPPLLVRNGVGSFLEGEPGAMVGAGGGDVPEPLQRTVPLFQDDVLFLYTDGLIERREENLDDGLARLRVVTSAHVRSLGASCDPEALCDEVISRLLPENGPRSDDVVVLGLRVTSGSS